MREAEAHYADMSAEPPAPAAPAMKRNIPMSAPVSRDVPSASGGQSPSRVHLNAEERHIANVSFKHLPPHERDLAYARNRSRMHEMKKNGGIQGD
jgi:hypothetical protein